MGIADDPRDAGESREVLGSALCVTPGDDEASGGVLGVNLANGVASLSISGRGDGTCVYDDEISGSCVRDGTATPFEQLAFEGGTIGLGGAAAELLDVEGLHRKTIISQRNNLRKAHRVRSGLRIPKKQAIAVADRDGNSIGCR